MSAMDGLRDALDLVEKLATNDSEREAVELIRRAVVAPLNPVYEFPPDEEWTELPHYEQYLISTHGRLYSLRSRRLVQPQWRLRGRQKYPSLQWSVRRHADRPRSRFYVTCGVAVLRAFSDDVPDREGQGYTSEPLDGDPTNLRIDNLRWAVTGVKGREWT